MVGNRLKKGFSLIELMIAVSILAIGITAVLRSFVSVLSALDATSNRLAAIRVLEDKMTALEQGLRQDPEMELGADQGEVMIGQRPGRWTLEAEKIEEREEEEGADGREEDEEGEAREKAILYEVTLTVIWQENNTDKRSTLATYIYRVEKG